VNSNEPTDLKNNENELALEQARLERAKLELELEKTKQKTVLPSPQKGKETSSSNLPDKSVFMLLFFCLTFLAPIGLIILWRSKGYHAAIKVFLTLYSIFAFSMLMGWISFGLEPWHMILLFTGQ